VSGSARVVAVIQARTNSSRLPGKVLLPLAGAPLLQRLIERVRTARTIDALVVATSSKSQDDAIAELCAATQTICHRGSETDVLARVVEAADRERASTLVRLTGDNPFVDGTLVDLVVQEFQRANPPVHYAHNVEDCGFPFGLYVEVCEMAALREALQSTDAADREHVTWYVRRRPAQFRHLAVRAGVKFKERNLSIDTAEDYERLRPLFDSEYLRNPRFGYEALAALPSIVQ
jgi:spore coat polysaccharide biosynthesis protein SpsF